MRPGKIVTGDRGIQSAVPAAAVLLPLGGPRHVADPGREGLGRLQIVHGRHAGVSDRDRRNRLFAHVDRCNGPRRAHHVRRRDLDQRWVAHRRLTVHGNTSPTGGDVVGQIITIDQVRGQGDRTGLTRRHFVDRP